MQTQWRIGFVGATGLDYSALNAVYEGLGIDRADIPEIFHELQVIETNYLDAIKKNKPAK